MLGGLFLPPDAILLLAWKCKSRTLSFLLKQEIPVQKRVPYTLSDNRITQNYLAFSHITGNSKQDFTFTKKSKFEFTRMLNRFIPRITNHGKIKFSIKRHRKSIGYPLQKIKPLLFSPLKAPNLTFKF